MIKPRFSQRPFLNRSLAISLFAFVALAATRAADGDLDTTYGTSGKNSVSFGASDMVYGAYLQSDGKMLVAGGARPVSSEDFGVARFNADGSLDTGFGTSGKFSLDITTNASDRATGVAVQSDGKIIVSGYTRFASGNDNFAVIRLTSAGVLDTSFGTNGITQIDYSSRTDRAFCLKVMSDDRIVVGGWGSTDGSNYNFVVARLTASGALDTTFDTDGKVMVDVGSVQDSGDAMAIQSDGKILLGGNASSGGDFELALLRLNTNGSLDTTFDSDGYVWDVLGGSGSRILGLATQADGKIVAVGYNNSGGGSDGLVARFTATGALDTTFNSTGYLIVDLGSSSDQFVGVTLQSDGKILAGGLYVNGTSTDSALVRVTSSGALDTTFALNGKRQLSLGSAGDKIVGLGLQSTSQIVAAIETAEASSSENFGVARFLNTASNTAPTISNVADQATSQSVATSAIAVTVGDTETAAGSLVVTGSSGNQTLVPNANIAFGGSGANRTVTLTPAVGLTGSATITLTVTDAGALTATDTFVLTVSDTTAPTVTSVVRLTPSNQTITAGPVVFRVTYSEAVTNVTTSNFAVEAINGGSVVGTVTNVSGSGTTRDVTVSLTSGAGGFRLNVVDNLP